MAEPSLSLPDGGPSRRDFLRLSAGTLASLAFPWSRLWAQAGPAPGFDAEGGWRGILDRPHFPPRIRRIIHLYMAGGPSQFETFDPKPRLAEMHGQPMPESFTKGQPIAQLQGKPLVCMAPQYPFRRCGESGQEISVLFPHIGSLADELCIVRSMQGEQINHDPAHVFMNTGTIIAGRPSMGSWLLYALGAATEDLPGFVVLTSQGGGQGQPISARQWHSGFLPSRFQGVRLASGPEVVYHTQRPDGVPEALQEDVIGAAAALNRLAYARHHDPEALTRVAQYELARRMHASVPELADLSDEPPHVLQMYGVSSLNGTFAANCLLARRLAERGVRCIQLYHRGWDHHQEIRTGMEAVAPLVDQPTAALLRDLKQRGMLEDTLVLWGGEFGRTPMAQDTGRDHHIRAFSLFLAGGGVKGGLTHGASDELGYFVAEDPVSVHDLHATILYLFGIDHEKLTYRFQGRDFRLTDVKGKIVTEILA